MKLDDFASVFRSAFKEGFALQPPSLRRVLLVTDLDRAGAQALEGRVRAYLSRMDDAAQVQWQTLSQEDYQRDIPALLEAITEADSQMIVSYRHLGGRVKDLRHSLGSVLDVVAQATEVPVLVLPNPERPEALARTTRRVMVATDHLTGDAKLVNWAAQLCDDDGELFLVHVEDVDVFEHYAEVIGKLPGLDTERTVRRIRERLLQLPSDYIAEVREALAAAGAQETVHAEVHLGRPLEVYRELLAKHQIDLLVVNANAEGQEAMDGLSYTLAVELLDQPLLLR